jgi:hypothetical protein
MRLEESSTFITINFMLKVVLRDLKYTDVSEIHGTTLGGSFLTKTTKKPMETRVLARFVFELWPILFRKEKEKR